MFFPNAANQKLNATENNDGCATSRTPGISPVWNPAIQTGHRTITRAGTSKNITLVGSCQSDGEDDKRMQKKMVGNFESGQWIQVADNRAVSKNSFVFQ